jgi:hypothetical protein
MGKAVFRKTKGFQGSVRLGNIDPDRMVLSDFLIGHVGSSLRFS